MKKAIIHISDLHVTYHKDTNGDLIDKQNIHSYFNTEPNDAEVEAYLNKIINYIKCNYSNIDEYEFYLLVTGDITDHGLEQEFKKAEELLSKFIKDLNIEKNRVLLVPGDHDVNWDCCNGAYRELDSKARSRSSDRHQ